MWNNDLLRLVQNKSKKKLVGCVTNWDYRVSNWNSALDVTMGNFGDVMIQSDAVNIKASSVMEQQ